MNLVSLSARNALRNRFRTTLTVLGVAVAVVAFILLRTVIWAYSYASEAAATDRIITRHKVTFVMTLPRRYVEQVKQTAGVTQVTWANWFGGKDPKHEREFFSTLGVDHETYFDVADEMVVPKEQLEAWKLDRRGAVIGDALAKKFGWKVGDRVSIASQIFPGDWEFTIDGIYTASRRSADRSTFLFHWDYLNEALPARRRDQIGWIISRVKDSTRTADLGLDIDRSFDDREIQTVSQSERAFNLSFLGMFSAILKALDVVSIVILAIMMLILGNTIAMGVRERTNEYGTLRAIGFLPRHLSLFVLGEAVVIGASGGLLGIALAFPIVEKGMGRWLEENMGGFFPYFRVPADTMVASVALAVGLSLAAAAIPAYRASKLRVVDALRRVA